MRIEEVEKRGWPIRKQTRYFAIAPNGIYYELPYSAKLEYGRQWCKMPTPPSNKGDE